MNNSNSLLWSLGKMDINAHDGAFVNDYNGNVLSMGDMSLIAKTIINSAGSFAPNRTSILMRPLWKTRAPIRVAPFRKPKRRMPWVDGPVLIM